MEVESKCQGGSRRRVYTLGLAGLAVVAVVAVTLGVSIRSNDGKNSGPKFEARVWPEEPASVKVKRNPQFGFSKTPFNLQEILDNNFQSETWNGSWVSDTQYVYKDEDSSLVLVNARSGTTRTIVPGSVMRDPRVFRFKLSPDLRFVMLAFRPQRLFRHSFLAQYDVYNIQTGRRSKLQPDLDQLLRALGGPAFGGPGGGGGGGGGGPPPPPGGGRGGPQGPPPGGLGGGPNGPPQLPLELAMWGPTGSSIAYVFGANIYYRQDPDSADIMITTTGRPGVVYNGVADWVYEEEVLSDTRALWFSPDGERITWIEFNDTNVDVMTITHYGQPGNLQFQYPIQTPLRYPKPGRANPTVNVYTVRVRGAADNPAKTLLEPPNYFSNRERYIYAITWPTSGEVSLTWENRHQNYSVVSVCQAAAGACADSLVMTSPGGWLELEEAPVYTKDGRRFAMALSANGYKQVNVINRDTNQRVPITSGNMVVTNVYFWDERNHEIYFKATKEDSPGERHLYKVTDFQADQPGLVTCLSCDELNTRGGACGYNSFEFSHDKSFYAMSCNGPHVPQVYLYATNPNRRLNTLVQNAKLSNDLAQKALPKVSNLNIPVDGGRYQAKVRLYLPPDFNERKKYPLVINVYGGPNSQQVNDRFKLDWGTYLTTSEGVIYGLIDGRGSGFKGDDMLHEIYYNIGIVEVEDQITVTKQLITLYPFIDKTKVAIWGWSYGGFVTASVLAKDADRDNIFQCGISVAPVTNWIYYDSIYTERYLGLPTPDDNLAGYQASDVTSKARKLANKKYLMVHGTADDNVHYQQSMMLARSLEEADVLFRQLSYPDEAHGLVGLRPHFYHSLTDFLINDCFGRNEIISG
jgi:dipeptidyl-peptidase-4